MVGAMPASGPSKAQITAVVLAGGLGRRMSADGRGINKAMVQISGQPMIAHVIERIRTQVNSILINADPQQPDWSMFGLPIIADQIADRPGPLAGIHAALSCVDTPWLLSVPCDTPRLPHDLVARLARAQAQSGADRVSVRCAAQRHPVIALVHRSLAAELEAFVRTGGRRIESWLSQGQWAEAEFEDETEFVNVNTADELQHLERSQ